MIFKPANKTIVSTHSRLKAAGHRRYPLDAFRACFNTQPPEGGWDVETYERKVEQLFQHTAA